MSNTARQPDPVDIHVGGRLRMARTVAVPRISQEQLAAALGLTFQQVQKYERGQNRISASKLHKASLFLNRPVAWFFEGLASTDGTVADPTTGTVDALLAIRGGFEMIKAFLTFSSRKQLALMGVISAMAGVEPES